MVDVLKDAARATADLTQPVRLIPGETGGFILQTNKGENMPAGMTKESAHTNRTFFEKLLLFVDEKMGVDEETDDETVTDAITAPEWFGPYKHTGAFYCLEDLSLQLDPNRSATLLEPLRDIRRSDDDDDDDDVFDRLAAVLDQKCMMNSSCVYRLLYPHVDAAGPIALSPIVLTLLTRGVTLAAVNVRAMSELVEAVASVLLPEQPMDKRDVWQADAFRNKTTSTNLCISCILANQTRSYVDAYSETAINTDVDGLLEATTFLGVLKTAEAHEGRLRNEVDFFSPVVNVHEKHRCYLADGNPFAEYNVERIAVNNGTRSLWVVTRNAIPQPPPTKLHAMLEVEKKIPSVGKS
jgi:hypothetical protein